ncbi:TRAP transporter substrate-binding protein [Marinobacter salarius]|uniref:TRAP transporter substrate-binding protein n=1 Tax=Marinobacter salarius TaxID=1420917 RepID=UPI00273AE8BE|nr:TRAP transporter substrate-binding protein [Marinobacter salarius]MDP4532894.1 TRAP transporter substrate-binding protein [Marinobacter salarius]
MKNKEKTGKFHPIYALSALLVGFLLSNQALSQDRVRWQVPISIPSTVPAVGTPVKHLSSNVEEVSGGNVQLRYYEPGELVPAFEVLSSVSDGKFNAGYTWIGYDAGKIPALNLLGGGAPFGLSVPAFLAWHYYGDGNDLLQEVYRPHGIKALLCGIVGPEGGGWFNKKIESVNDIKGLKIRFAGIGGEVFRRFGASINLLPGGELYQALERGVIDATEFSSPAADQSIALHEVAKYYYLPGWHQSATMFHLLVNQKSWDGLSDQVQAQIETSCKAATTTSYAESEKGNALALKFWQEKGVDINKYSQDLLDKFRDKSEEVLKEYAGKDDMFAKVLESQKAWKEIYGTWGDEGYLK